MGQGDIVEVLKKHGGWLTTAEIADKTGTATSSALVKLRKLRKQGDIVVKEFNGGYSYKIKDGK